MSFATPVYTPFQVFSAWQQKGRFQSAVIHPAVDTVTFGAIPVLPSATVTGRQTDVMETPAFMLNRQIELTKNPHVGQIPQALIQECGDSKRLFRSFDQLATAIIQQVYPESHRLNRVPWILSGLLKDVPVLRALSDQSRLCWEGEGPKADFNLGKVWVQIQRLKSSPLHNQTYLITTPSGQRYQFKVFMHSGRWNQIIPTARHYEGAYAQIALGLFAAQHRITKDVAEMYAANPVAGWSLHEFILPDVTTDSRSGLPIEKSSLIVTNPEWVNYRGKDCDILESFDWVQERVSLAEFRARIDQIAPHPGFEPLQAVLPGILALQGLDRLRAFRYLCQKSCLGSDADTRFLLQAIPENISARRQVSYRKLAMAQLWNTRFQFNRADLIQRVADNLVLLPESERLDMVIKILKSGYPKAQKQVLLHYGLLPDEDRQAVQQLALSMPEEWIRRLAKAIKQKEGGAPGTMTYAPAIQGHVPGDYDTYEPCVRQWMNAPSEDILPGFIRLLETGEPKIQSQVMSEFFRLPKKFRLAALKAAISRPEKAVRQAAIYWLGIMIPINRDAIDDHYRLAIAWIHSLQDTELNDMLQNWQNKISG